MYRAIYFPVKEAKPKFVWVSLKDSRCLDMPALLKTWFAGRDDTFPVAIENIPSLALQPDHNLLLQCHEFFAVGDFPLNECI